MLGPNLAFLSGHMKPILYQLLVFLLWGILDLELHSSTNE